MQEMKEPHNINIKMMNSLYLTDAHILSQEEPVFELSYTSFKFTQIKP